MEQPLSTGMMVDIFLPGSFPWLAVLVVCFQWEDGTGLKRCCFLERVSSCFICWTLDGLTEWKT